MKKKQNKKNGFLITWSACIVLLLVLCFFGISDSMKGTQAKECYIYNGIEYCQNSAPSGFSSTVKDSTYVPGDDYDNDGDGYVDPGVDTGGSGGSNDDDDDGGGSTPGPDITTDYDECISSGNYWYGGMCVSQDPSNPDTWGPSGDSGNDDDDDGGSCSKSAPDGMVCSTDSNGCVVNCQPIKDIVGGNDDSEEAWKGVEIPTCGGSGNKWTVSSCLQFGNVIDGGSCCVPSKVTEDEAAASEKEVHSNKSYTITVTKADGTVLKYNYTKDGKLMSIITTDPNGNQSLDTTENSNLNGSIINYYNNLEECNYMVADNNSYCVPYRDTYVTITQARTKMTYTSEAECMSTTGLECEYRTYPDNPEKGYFMSVECDCEDEGDCLNDPTPTPGKPSNPTIKDPVEDFPSNPSSPSYSKPSSSSEPSNSNDRGDGCYKNKDTGEFKWFESDPELGFQTNLYEKVDDSKCDVDGGGNIIENPQTGEIAIFLIWILGFGAVGYSVWYYIKSRKEN